MFLFFMFDYYISSCCRALVVSLVSVHMSLTHPLTHCSHLFIHSSFTLSIQPLAHPFAITHQIVWSTHLSTHSFTHHSLIYLLYFHTLILCYPFSHSLAHSLISFIAHSTHIFTHSSISFIPPFHPSITLPMFSRTHNINLTHSFLCSIQRLLYLCFHSLINLTHSLLCSIHRALYPCFLSLVTHQSHSLIPLYHPSRTLPMFSFTIIH